MKIELLKTEDYKLLFSGEIKRILFLGDVDTGKTTLLKTLGKKYVENSIPVSIIDCDVGQSTVGPPTTISFIKAKKRIYNFFPFPEKFYFTGVISPSANIIAFLTGLEKVNHSCKDTPGKILIDTTGYIKDKTAQEIKIHKIEIFTPDIVLLFEKNNELNFIKEFLKGTKIRFLTVKVPESFPCKTFQERSENRKNKFNRYFKNSMKIRINLKDVSIKFINLNEQVFSNNWNNLLLSLRDENLNDRILGVIVGKEGNILEILCPKGKYNFTVKNIVISNLRLNFKMT